MPDRDIAGVIRSIQDSVPEGLRHSFDATLTSVAYTAPEAVVLLWGELSEVVNLIVGPSPLVEEWKIVVVSLLTGVPESDVKSRYGTGGEESI